MTQYFSQTVQYTELLILLLFTILCFTEKLKSQQLPKDLQ